MFMPPVIELEDYLALVSAVEATAAELSLGAVKAFRDDALSAGLVLAVSGPAKAAE